MARVTEKKRPRRTAERILEAALERFNRFGERNVSTTSIATEIGISPGNLYYHYPAKEGLVNKLFDRWGSSEIKLILTQAVDVTVLPGFAPAFTTSGEEYKGVAKTLAHWNAKLREAVKDWNRGYVYLFNANEFLLDRIRDQQFYASGITAASGLGANIDPGWENVANACVESNGGIQVMMSKSEKTKEHVGVHAILMKLKGGVKG